MQANASPSRSGRGKRSKSSCVRARVSCRARSDRKLKKITESPGEMGPTALPSRWITTGSLNSSVTPASSEPEAAVEDRVDHHLLPPPLPRHLEKGGQVRVERVHAPVGEESNEMERLPAPPGRIHRFAENRIPEKIAIPDRLRPPDDILVDDPARPQVQAGD